MSALLPASCLGLLFAIMEFLVMLPDEINIIWVRPFTLTFPKFLYVFCRYFSLAAHALHVVLSRRVVSLSCPRFHLQAVDMVPDGGYLYLAECDGLGPHDTHSFFISFHPIVYAFYRRGRQIGVLLTILFVIRFVLAISSAVISPPSQTFDEYCKPPMPKVVIFCFLVTEMITQCVILGLTFAKQILSSRDTQIRAPVTSLLYRDGVLTYGAVFAGLIAILVDVKLGLLRDFTPFMFPIFTSILSSSTCRMVINIQRLAAEIPTADMIELTDVLESIGDMGDSSS